MLSKFLPANDRDFLTKCQLLSGLDEVESDLEVDYLSTVSTLTPDTNVMHPVVELDMSHILFRHVNVKQSLYLHAFYDHHPLHLTIDTGADTNMIHTSLEKYIGAKIDKSSRMMMQADGQTSLTI